MTEALCGRPMKKGGICRLRPLVTDFGTRQERRWPACYNHLSSQERAAYVDSRKTSEDEQDRWWAQVRPACWGWTVEGPVEAWSPSFPVGPEDHQYTQESAEDLLELCKDPEYRGSLYMAEWQAGRCAICSLQSDLVEDHDHVTGLVRGLLCRSCNTREGMDRGSVGPFAKYRERNPASMLGIRVRYWDPVLQDYAPEHPPEVDRALARAENPWLRVQAKRRGES